MPSKVGNEKKCKPNCKNNQIVGAKSVQGHKASSYKRFEVIKGGYSWVYRKRMNVSRPMIQMWKW